MHEEAQQEVVEEFAIDSTEEVVEADSAVVDSAAAEPVAEEPAIEAPADVEETREVLSPPNG